MNFLELETREVGYLLEAKNKCLVKAIAKEDLAGEKVPICFGMFRSLLDRWGYMIVTSKHTLQPLTRHTGNLSHKRFLLCTISIQILQKPIRCNPAFCFCDQAFGNLELCIVNRVHYLLNTCILSIIIMEVPTLMAKTWSGYTDAFRNFSSIKRSFVFAFKQIPNSPIFLKIQRTIENQDIVVFPDLNPSPGVVTYLYKTAVSRLHSILFFLSLHIFSLMTTSIYLIAKIARNQLFLRLTFSSWRHSEVLIWIALARSCG